MLCSEGEKLSFSNDNLVVKHPDGKIKFQCTAYRLFVVFVVGHTSITSALIQKTTQFGFFIALLTPGFRLYSVIGAAKDSNTLLRKKQYSYEGIDIARVVVHNKIINQLYELKSVRDKSENLKNAVSLLNEYAKNALLSEELSELMAYEGLASKAYFRNHFNNVPWQGRQPRIKRDFVNAALDIGYTLLFTFVDALLMSYGFDTYCGIMHRQFYMRKSLTCDIVEPFRCLIDHEIKKAINLRQIKSEDFLVINRQYRLKWEKSADYIKVLMKPLIENKENIFAYIQHYYRAFMKELPAEEFPTFEQGASE